MATDRTLPAEKNHAPDRTIRGRPPGRPPGTLGISPGIYLLSDAARRLKWGRKTTEHAIAAGLRTVLFGRCRYVRFEALLDFFSALEEEQAAQAGQETGP
jgi:hypothetical protein